MLDRTTVLADTARILDIDVDELDPSASLVDQGLDSVRLMALVEQWRSAGIEVAFGDLASAPDLQRWIAPLARR